MNKLKAYSISKLFTILLASLFLFSCKPEEQTKQILQTTKETKQDTNPFPSRTLLIRASYDNFVLNPSQLQTQSQGALLRDLLEGLVILDPRGNVQAGVAESWQTADNKTWIFTLRPNATWSNGIKVVAQDFVQSWQQLASSASPLKSYLQYINLMNAKAVIDGQLEPQQLGVKALSELQLQIQLDKATASLPAMLAHIALLPTYSQSQHFVGNGAYQLQQQQEKGWLLEKNPYYWDSQKVSFKQVEYRKIEPSQSITDIDLLENPQLEKENLHYFPRLCTYFYAFNLTHPQLKQTVVRHALSSMIAPHNLLKNNQIKWISNRSLLPQNMQFQTEQNFDTVLIEQQLQQAGIDEAHPLHLRLTYDNQLPHSQIAQSLIQTWGQSDLIRIESETVNAQTLLEKQNNGDFQLIRSGWCADYNDASAFLSPFYSRSPDNKTRFNDPEIDKLLEQSTQTTDNQQRQNLYAQITDKLQQQYIVIPLFQYTKPMWLSPSLAGYHQQNPSEIFYSKDLYRRIAPCVGYCLILHNDEKIGAVVD